VAAAPSLTGVTLDGRYELGRMVGGGGMGHVYEAEHLGTGRRVAVKVISNPELAKDPHIVGRFQREADAAGAIDTPHICRVLDTGSDPESGAPFMVMELMTGEDVQQLQQRLGPLPPELALRIAAQACLGLARAHDVDVVHRDVKPANLFLAQQPGSALVVKLLDFGIAKVKMERAHDIANAELTRTGMLLGSPLYMSPEQALGTKKIDRRADIWSLGVVMYQLLTGRTPYMHATALGELIMAICSEAPKPVQDLAPWVPPEVAHVVHRALRSGVDDRYQTATEMHDAIAALIPGGSSTIESAMLVSLDDEQRAEVAPKASAPPPPPARAPSVLPYAPTIASIPPPSSMPPPGSIPLPAAAPSPASMPPPRSTFSSSAGAAAHTAHGPASLGAPPSSLVAAEPSNKRFVVLGAALGVVVAGGIAVFSVLGATKPAADTSVASAPPAPAAASPSASPGGPTVAPSPQERTVKLVLIAPDDVEVTLDGVPVKAKNGLLEITGIPGSVHKVNLKSKDGEVEEDVVVAENGALPPKVTLEKGAKPKRSGAPAGSAKKKDPRLGIEEKFE
jgi:serine/threonine protein kinase